jgi:hypothetical protein
MFPWRRSAKMAAQLCYGVLLVAAAVCGVHSVRPSQAQGADKIVARVNDEPIYESEISKGIPQNAFLEDAMVMRHNKLEHRISQLQLQQYLKAHKAEAISEVEVDKALDALRRNPPSLGCPCCRYSSLEQFLRANMLTMAEFREDVRDNGALDRYILNLWNQAYPTHESRAALIASQRIQTESQFTRAWQIFFNTYQRLDAANVVKKQAQAKAEAAWQRLQKGESFADVAKSVSEDQMSRSAGGRLGCIFKDAYGKDFAAMLTRLKPGEVSRPFESIYGFHIIKWEPIQDTDLLEISKRMFSERRAGEILEEAAKNTNVVRY